MELQPGDWVRADTGEVGRVVHIVRMSVFIQIEGESTDATLRAFLQSRLTKIEPPSSAGAESQTT